jgi:PAS domain S-box-containing protein
MAYNSRQAAQLLDPLPVAAYIWSRTTRKFLGSNQALRDLLGYTDLEISQLDWPEMMAADEIANAEREISIGLRMQRVKWRWRRKDGTILPVTLASREMNFIDDEGNTHEAYFAVVLNVDENVIGSAAAFPSR